MKDLNEQFEIFLTKWCKEHHKPRPEEGKINKYWQEAWTDFMKTELDKDWEERKNFFDNINLLTKTEQRRMELEEKLNSQYEDDVTEQKPTSSWERIQRYLH